jgi:eukaryotic-like serine/threonine-protein kinase
LDSDLEVAKARLGRRVGDRWLLERVLGTGGMAAVYAGRAPDGSVAAVKILHPEMGARREVRERFLREGSAANKIGHPGVVQMVGQGDGEEAFLAMELLEGETLRDRVRRHGRLPLDEVLDYAEQVLDVLVAAHERGVVHRDLKPDNLFVTHGDRIKVLDFGLARLLDGVPGQHQTRTGVALGTLAYMAPEQALGRRGEIDGRVDVFALGATMFRVLSGRRVHEAESEAELLMAMASRPAPPLRTVAPQTPESVAGIVDLSLAFSRDARYPDARTMRSDVQAARRGAAPPYATSRLASRDERTRADQPAYVPTTQPLDTVRDPTGGRTVPLAAFTEPTAPYPASAPAPLSSAPTVVDVPPLSVRGPVSTRTEPLAQVPVAAAATYPGPPSTTVPAPQAFLAAPPGASLPGAPPVAVTQPPARSSRGVLALLVVLGTLAVAAAGGLVAYFIFGQSPTDANDGATVALPAPLPAAEPAVVDRKPASDAARAATATATAPTAQAKARTTTTEPARPDVTAGGSARASTSVAPEPTPAPTPTPTPSPTPSANATATASAAATSSAAAPVPTPADQAKPAPQPDAGASRVQRGRGRGARN